MELFRVHSRRNVGLDNISSNLSGLLTSFLNVAWCAGDMIGILACQHFFTQAPIALQRRPPDTGDEQEVSSGEHHGTECGVRRGVEIDRAMTGGRQ